MKAPSRTWSQDTLAMVTPLPSGSSRTCVIAHSLRACMRASGHASGLGRDRLGSLWQRWKQTVHVLQVRQPSSSWAAVRCRCQLLPCHPWVHPIPGWTEFQAKALSRLPGLGPAARLSLLLLHLRHLDA